MEEGPWHEPGRTSLLEGLLDPPGKGLVLRTGAAHKFCPRTISRWSEAGVV